MSSRTGPRTAAAPAAPAAAAAPALTAVRPVPGGQSEMETEEGGQDSKAMKNLCDPINAIYRVNTPLKVDNCSAVIVYAPWVSYNDTYVCIFGQCLSKKTTDKYCRLHNMMLDSKQRVVDYDNSGGYQRNVNVYADYSDQHVMRILNTVTVAKLTLERQISELKTSVKDASLSPNALVSMKKELSQKKQLLRSINLYLNMDADSHGTIEKLEELMQIANRAIATSSVYLMKQIEPLLTDSKIAMNDPADVDNLLVLLDNDQPATIMAKRNDDTDNEFTQYLQSIKKLLNEYATKFQEPPNSNKITAEEFRKLNTQPNMDVVQFMTLLMQKEENQYKSIFIERYFTPLMTPTRFMLAFVEGITSDRVSLYANHRNTRDNYLLYIVECLVMSHNAIQQYIFNITNSKFEIITTSIMQAAKNYDKTLNNQRNEIEEQVKLQLSRGFNPKQ